MSGNNYFRQPSGFVVQGSDVSLGPERKLCPNVRCFTGAWPECGALSTTSVHFWRIAKQAPSGGLAVACLDSPSTDRPLIKEGEEKQHKQAVESLPSRPG